MLEQQAEVEFAPVKFAPSFVAAHRENRESYLIPRSQMEVADDVRTYHVRQQTPQQTTINCE